MAEELTIYSELEEGWMGRWQRGKDRLLGPLITLLVQFKIPAWVVSGGGAGVAVVGAWIGVATGSWTPFLWLLLLHVILDGVDGALARHNGVGRWGTLLDVGADTVGIVTASVAAVKLLHMPGSLVTCYTFLYVLVLWLALRRRSLGVPFRWLLRPRLPMYGLLILDALTGTRLLGFYLLAATLVLAWQVFSGWRALKRVAPGHHRRHRDGQTLPG